MIADPLDAQRFAGIVRLYGAAGFARLQAATAMVVGLGGVGSWTVEALARSGVGRLVLVDLDEVCISNTNRQLHALTGTMGRAKAEVLAERVRAIAPACEVEVELAFFTAASAAALLARTPTVVIDAIDSLHAKVALVAACQARGVPVVVCGGAGGRCDPLALRRGDLATSAHDGLLRALRRGLREQGACVGPGPWGVEAVWSSEAQRWPEVACASDDGGSGSADAAAEAVGDRGPVAGRRPRRLDCAEGFGAVTMVTGTFGFALAAAAVDRIVAG